MNDSVNVPNLAPERCNWCSHFRPRYRTHSLSTGQTICEYCLDAHFRALDYLGGAIPDICQECLRSWKDIGERDPQALAVKMFIHRKDGILQMLCDRCTDAYTHKRTDLYKGTQFGQSL